MGVITALDVVGTTTFNGAVGSTTDVGDGTGASIAITSTGITSFESTVDGASGITQARAAGALTFKDNVTLADGDTATSLAGAVTLDGLNWSGYDGLTIGADLVNRSGRLKLERWQYRDGCDYWRKPEPLFE